MSDTNGCYAGDDCTSVDEVVMLGVGVVAHHNGDEDADIDAVIEGGGAVEFEVVRQVRVRGETYETAAQMLPEDVTELVAQLYELAPRLVRSAIDSVPEGGAA